MKQLKQKAEKEIQTLYLIVILEERVKRIDYKNRILNTAKMIEHKNNVYTCKYKGHIFSNHKDLAQNNQRYSWLKVVEFSGINK